MHKIAYVALLFGGCSIDVIFLELLVTNDPGCGTILTFARFLFIALEGLIFTNQFGRRKSVVPIRKYVILVLIVFTTSVLNNLVLNFNISMPLHMIFRSGSLIMNMVLGIVILKRRYTFSKYISIIMITVGITTCTFESGNYIKHLNEPVMKNGVYDLMIWSMGLVLMTVSIFLSAIMSIYLESLSMEYGKNPREALFYSHALPLPGFLLFGKDIYNHGLLFNKSDPVMLPLLGFSLPKMWVYFFVNVLMNCSASVFLLASVCSSLSVTLAVTLRKFFSLMLSILYFKNLFTSYHWMGTFLVFLGTMIYTEMIPNAESFMPKLKKQFEKFKLN